MKRKEPTFHSNNCAGNCPYCQFLRKDKVARIDNTAKFAWDEVSAVV